MPTTDFDALWDYSKSDETERKFREVLTELLTDDTLSPELLTQIARAQGFNGNLMRLTKRWVLSKKTQ